RAALEDGWPFGLCKSQKAHVSNHKAYDVGKPAGFHHGIHDLRRFWRRKVIKFLVSSYAASFWVVWAVNRIAMSPRFFMNRKPYHL
ncbi:MAG: hypothetical protein M1596_06145, partial [Firmicutes bacterium]|nr:hypothetical protein [Bacillota bacterium]